MDRLPQDFYGAISRSRHTGSRTGGSTRQSDSTIMWLSSYAAYTIHYRLSFEFLPGWSVVLWLQEQVLIRTRCNATSRLNRTICYVASYTPPSNTISKWIYALQANYRTIYIYACVHVNNRQQLHVSSRWLLVSWQDMHHLYINVVIWNRSYIVRVYGRTLRLSQTLTKKRQPLKLDTKFSHYSFQLSVMCCPIHLC